MAAHGGGVNPYTPNDLACVYRAVAEQGATAEQVRAIVATGGGLSAPQARDEWRVAVVNYKTDDTEVADTPLCAAHRRRDGPLVGALLEAGAADASFFAPSGNALALAIHHGQIDAVRALLRSERHDADEKVALTTTSRFEPEPDLSCFARPAHLAVVPPPWASYSAVHPPPQLEILTILGHEFSANMNGRDHRGQTPLHWLHHVSGGSEHRERALDALLALGADTEARDGAEVTPIYQGLSFGAEGLVPLFLDRGASPDALLPDGSSLLLRMCRDGPQSAVERVAPLLLRASAPATRRAVDHEGKSAADHLVERYGAPESGPLLGLVEHLLVSRTPVLPAHAPLFLRAAARVGTRLERAVAELPPVWQVHEGMVKLAFDFQEAREDDVAVAALERRAHELEENLRARGEEGEEEGGGGGGGGGGSGGGGSDEAGALGDAHKGG
jgi:hypothetical protein